MRSREFINESPELAEKYKAHLIKTLPLLMNFLSKTSKEYLPTEDEMLDVIETGYEVMLQSGDKNKAGEAVRNKLKFLMNKKSMMESLYVDVPNEDWLQDKIDYTKSKGRDKFGAPFFTSTTAYFTQDVRVPIQILRRLPGIEGEQQNVRSKDLMAIKKIMKDTGKLPMHNNKEYVPYVRVAYNGEAWVFNGNHRIMAAAELFDEGDKRFSELPINLSYHDGGERVKSGPLSPEKIGNQNVMEGSYREGGSITHDGVEYDFDSVMSIAEKMPTKTCSVDKLSWVLEYDTPNKERLERADITVPLIVTKSVNGKLAAIDGLHRLAKAVRDNVKTLPVKYIKPSELESAKLNKQGVSEAVQNFNIGYHVTKKQNVPFIMKNGLVGGKTSGFTLGGEWADAIYGRRPIYVALDKDLYKDTETTELKIDLRGLRLVPDLPSLIDLGAMVSNNNSIYWKHDEDIPKLLMDYAEDGEIFYYDLLKNENVIRAAILSTRTAAILDSIPANKIFTEFYRQGVAEAWSEKYKKSINCNNPRGFSQRAHCQGRKKNNEQLELSEIGFSQELDSSNFQQHKIISMSKIDGQIDGHDVYTASAGNQTVYFLLDDNNISSFLGFEDGKLKNIKNFTKTPGVVRALLGYLVHIKKQTIEISDTEPLTQYGLNWLINLIQKPRGLKITSQNGKPIDIELLQREWKKAKQFGITGPTSIRISEHTLYGDKLRLNEKTRYEKSLIMPYNFYIKNTYNKRTYENI